MKFDQRFLRLYKLSNKLTELEGKKIAYFTNVDEVKPYKEYIKFSAFPMEDMVPVPKAGVMTVYKGPC